MHDFVAFVAGASGYTGQAVVGALIARGIHTIAHVRPDSPHLDECCKRFTKIGARIDTTPWNERELMAAFARCNPSLVFALLGATRSRARQAGVPIKHLYEDVDRRLTLMLLAAAVQVSHPRFVYLSSAGANRSPVNTYLRVRYEVEEAVRASGLPYTIARPSFITGTGREEVRPGERFGAALLDSATGVARLFGASRWSDRYRSITGTALANVLVQRSLFASTRMEILETEMLRE